MAAAIRGMRSSGYNEIMVKLSPNQRISEYVLEAKVGGGTFGEVWRAHHHVWADHRVAIKIPTDAQYVRNLQREGVTIHGLVHPNIVRALGFDPYADPPYLTMEYVPGTSLRPLIQRAPLPAEDAVAIMRQVLEGLSFAHDRGVVHRDVKPENILIHERAQTDGYGIEGVVKVTDFGLGRAATTTAVGSIAYSASMNDPAGKELAGTLDYMAPEQRSGGEVDARADLYACGVVLYEMLTGERPAGTDVPSDLNPKSPGHLDEVFRRSYARLERRFMSAGEFMDALLPGKPPPLPAVPPRLDQRQDPPAHGQQRCPQCRHLVDQHDQFCIHCGTQLVPTVRRCDKCGAYPDAMDRYCIFCGQELSPAAATVA
jgi:serine/threonine protein kinase